MNPRSPRKAVTETAPRRPVNAHPAYHAHVYYDDESFAFAEALCKQAGERFKVAVGRMHRKPVGPHPRWSCQIAFDAASFDAVIPWLDANRGDLTVFIHGRTGDDLADHTDYAYWLGDAVELNLAFFKP